LDELRVAASTDLELLALRQKVQSGNRGTDWAVIDDLVICCGWVYLPASSPGFQEVLTTVHGTGHEGGQKTLHHLQHTFFIPGALGIVQDFVRSCVTCQRNKMEQLHPAGLLQPLQVLSMVWADIAMDFVEALPKVSGKSIILMVVDRFSKYAHFIPLGHPYTATTMARAFFSGIIRLHGLPSSIVSDRDPTFTSYF
jgi:hypothetical protein